MSGTAPDAAHPAILRAAVASQIESLDEQFLAALNGYINAASVREDRPLLRMLLAIREETLAAVSARLPAALQVVEALSQASGGAARAEILKLASAGGGLYRPLGMELPEAPLSDVENASARLLEQMEDRDEVVADAQLLVRVALAREAARDALAARKRKQGGGAEAVTAPPAKVISAHPPFHSLHRIASRIASIIP
jgi:hypothetical protein